MDKCKSKNAASVSEVLALTRKDMALSAISLNSAFVDKEFILSLHHKLNVHVLKWVNVSTKRMMYTNTINQLFTQSINHHKQQRNLPPWWNYLQVFIQRRSLIERLHRPKFCKIILPWSAILETITSVLYTILIIFIRLLRSNKKSLRFGTSTCLILRLFEIE